MESNTIKFLNSMMRTLSLGLSNGNLNRQMLDISLKLIRTEAIVCVFLIQ